MNTEIAERIWGKYKKEIFSRLQAGEHIHGTKFYQIRREMEKLGCDPVFADRYIQNQLYDMRMKIAEQAEAS